MNLTYDRTDRAAENYLTGEPVPEDTQSVFEALQSLEGLREIPALAPLRAATARRNYLDQVQEIRSIVSPQGQSRLNGWLSTFRKEHAPMFTAARIITIAAILLGGTTGTALAARESAPDQALYPMKILLEDLRLGLTSDPQAEFDLLMQYIQDRVGEIETLVEKGLPVKYAVQLRLQHQLQAAFQNAANLDDLALQKAMEQVRTRSELQLQLLVRLNEKTQGVDRVNLGLAEQAVIQSRIHAKGALEDPTALRMRFGANRSEDAPEQPFIELTGDGSTGGAGPGAGSGPSSSKDPGSNPSDPNRGGRSD